MIYDIMCLLAYVPPRLNNDKSIMSSPYAWTDKSWQIQRRLNMYDRAMDPVFAEINDLCKTASYYKWADKKVRLGQAENFSHQGPEHCHIDNCKNLANCTKNKEVYLTVVQAHSS